MIKYPSVQIFAIFTIFTNFSQIREIKSSRNIWKGLIRENKSSWISKFLLMVVHICFFYNNISICLVQIFVRLKWNKNKNGYKSLNGLKL